MNFGGERFSQRPLAFDSGDADEYLFQAGDDGLEAGHVRTILDEPFQNPPPPHSIHRVDAGGIRAESVDAHSFQGRERSLIFDINGIVRELIADIGDLPVEPYLP